MSLTRDSPPRYSTNDSKSVLKVDHLSRLLLSQVGGFSLKLGRPESMVGDDGRLFDVEECLRDQEGKVAR